MSPSQMPAFEKPLDVGQLARISGLRVLLTFLVLALMFFWPAGTFRYWQAWTYLGVLFGSVCFVIIYFLRKDPRLLERRMRTKEKESQQRAIMKAGYLVFLVSYLVPGFDRRFGWSDVPTLLVLTADAVVLLGYLLFVFVLRENRYASRIIEVEQGQKLITTGPYAVVRHPMYAAALVICVASPLALGSYWGAAASLPIIGILVMRILNEEKVLEERLDGYTKYMQKTVYRMFPGVW